jgi:hypothetical protein
VSNLDGFPKPDTPEQRQIVSAWRVAPDDPPPGDVVATVEIPADAVDVEGRVPR